MKKAQTEQPQKLPSHNQIAWDLLAYYSPHSLNPKLTLDDIAKVTGLDNLTVKRLSQKLHILRTLRNTSDGLHYARMILTETDLDRPHYELD
jgi:hypothetical protein